MKENGLEFNWKNALKSIWLNLAQCSLYFFVFGVKKLQIIRSSLVIVYISLCSLEMYKKP